MPEEIKRTNMLYVDDCEKRFIEYCRFVEFGEMSVTIMRGRPIQGKKALASIRFDLPDIEKKMRK